MPSDKCNLIMAKAMGLIFFHCSMLLQPERCLLAYHSSYNAFFMVLLCVSLLTAKSVNLAVAHDGFPW